MADAMQNAVSAGGTFIDNVLGDPQEWKKHALQALREFLMEQARMSLMSSVTGAQDGDSLGTLLMRGLLGGFGGFRAEGGPVSAGKAYMVGERGPEMIVPSAPGHVIPNNKLGGGGPVDVRVGVTVDDDGKVRAYVQSATMAAESRAVAQSVKAIPGAMARYQSDGRI
jgi:hypothetical protein